MNTTTSTDFADEPDGDDDRIDRDDIDSTVEDVDHDASEVITEDSTQSEWQVWASWAIVALSMMIVWITVNPALIFDGSLTPTGGDMGAHVWGPQFLADELLPQFQLSGWTQDWYAGFPTYVYYMVVPALMIVWLAVKLPLWLMIPAALGLVGGLYWASQRFTAQWQRRTIITTGIVVGLFIIPIPYNVAFKLVAVTGMVTLPLALFALGKAAKAAFPIPALMSLGGLYFLFDPNFTILGGNGFSTMAGEFAFSLGLTAAVAYLATLLHGLETGRHRALGAFLLATTLLLHPIPAIFAAIATAILFFVRRDDETPWWESKIGRLASFGILGILAWTLISGGRLNAPWFFPDFISRRWPFVQPAEWLNEQWLFPALASLAALAFFTDFEPTLRKWWRTDRGRYLAAGLGTVIGLGALAVFFNGNRWGGVLLGLVAVYSVFGRIDVRLLKWQLLVAPVALLLTGFWLLPFVGSTTYMNDMGWEKYVNYSDHLLAVSSLDLGGMPYRNIVFILAGLGAILSFQQRQRIGYFCALGIVAFAWIFRYFPQYRLWNARLLPFYYLFIYLLAVMGLALAIRWIAQVLHEKYPGRFRVKQVRLLGVGVGVFLIVFALLGSLKFLPGGRLSAIPDSKQTNYEWGPFAFPASHLRDWAQWNFEGMERKPDYPEFARLIEVMDSIGAEHGCGRAMWEFESDMNRWGTPMALMLLPHFTNGCIGSMEGLYFEASSTTPFHFLNQAELSVAPSSAQRDLPYSGFNMEQGVSHMQLMGIQYYMATSDQAIQAAQAEPRLTQLHFESMAKPDIPGEFRDWAIFAVADTDIVVPLENEPVVLTDVDGHIDGWVYDAELPESVDGRPIEPKKPGPAVLWYNDPSRWDVFLAVDGPDSWPRTDSSLANVARVPLGDVNVTSIDVEQDSLRFEVDEVGIPILVKVSYFPNWTASGAEGPWRVTPNYMVVIPTEHTVELSYGRTPIELIGWLATLLGWVGLVGLIVVDHRQKRQDAALLTDVGDEVTAPADEQSTEQSTAQTTTEIATQTDEQNPQSNPQVDVEGMPGSQ